MFDDNPSSSYLAESIKRFLTKLAPGQSRIYYKVVPKELRENSGPYQGQFFYPSNPLGRNTVEEFLR